MVPCAELKRNLKTFWWDAMTNRRDDIEGLDAAILKHPEVWKTSGHVDEFTEPMVDCKTCKGRFRADKLQRVSLSAEAVENAARMRRRTDRTAQFQLNVQDLPWDRSRTRRR
jgi:glycyl-tRNA synthetase